MSTATVTSTSTSDRVAATCLPGRLDWSINSRRQSPCLVASTLGGLCFANSYALTQLPPEGDWHYSSLKAANGEDRPCLCNTVYYSLESACAACQHRDNDWHRWSYWSTNCSTTYTTYRQPIPSSVAIPAWAYLDVIKEDAFNLTLARSLTASPESVATTPASTETTPTPILTWTSNEDLSDRPAVTDPAINTSTKHAYTGAIVGGIIGGIGVILAVLFALYLLYRRRRKYEAGENSAAAEIASPVSPFDTGSTLETPLPRKAMIQLASPVVAPVNTETVLQFPRGKRQYHPIAAPRSQTLPVPVPPTVATQPPPYDDQF